MQQAFNPSTRRQRQVDLFTLRGSLLYKKLQGYIYSNIWSQKKKNPGRCMFLISAFGWQSQVDTLCTSLEYRVPGQPGLLGGGHFINELFLVFYFKFSNHSFTVGRLKQGKWNHKLKDYCYFLLSVHVCTFLPASGLMLPRLVLNLL